MKPSYTDGSVFLVPLRNGASPGVSSRERPQTADYCSAIFFGPRLASQSEADLSDLAPNNAILSLRFGDLGLFKGLWPIVGKLPSWDPVRWPMLNAVRRDPLGKTKPILVRYDANDPSKILSEEVMERDIDLPPQGLAGHGFVEARLSKLLE